MGKKHQILPEKYLKQQRPGSMAEVMKHLPSKCKALSSNSSTARKRERKKERERERERDLFPYGN
jgi:hypothetical protein